MSSSYSGRDEEILAAYAAGTDIGQIQRRYGVSEGEIHRIVAEDVGAEPRPSAAGSGTATRSRGPLAVAGMITIVLGLLGPLAGGFVWLLVYYVSATEYPIASLGPGN